MKKNLLIFVLFLLSVFFYAQEKSIDNGCVIEKNTINNHSYVIKKHNQTMKIGYSACDYNKTIYNDFLPTKKEIGKLKEGDIISISQLIILDDNETFLKIQTDSLSGFILFSETKYDLYKNGNWVYQETLQSGNRIYHIRKNSQYFNVYENLRIRDVPGLDGKKIGLIDTSKTKPVPVTTMAVTEEEDLIDGM